MSGFKIKNVKIKTNVVLAPMAGFSDVGLRALANKYGAGLTYTEMVSAKALEYKNLKTYDLLATTKSLLLYKYLVATPNVWQQLVKIQDCKSLIL